MGLAATPEVREWAPRACRLMRLVAIETVSGANFNGLLQLPCGERRATVLFFVVPTGAERSEAQRRGPFLINRPQIVERRSLDFASLRSGRR